MTVNLESVPWGMLRGVVVADGSREGKVMGRVSAGWVSGFLGMAIFSGSLPATRLAVADLDPLFVTEARAASAGLVALLLLLALRQKLPRRGDLGPLLVVALGVVVGFPLLTALALRQITSAHAMVYVGLLPLATAAFGAWRGGERPRLGFWLCAALGSGAVVAYALHGSAAGPGGGLGGGLGSGDGLMLVAVVVCGLGYAEGARLARRLGGWQVICWALVLAIPAMLPLALAAWPDWTRVGAAALGGLGYVSLFSMLIGFFFWYRGLALGGIAAVGQLQLLQPFLGMALAAGLLGERVGWDLAGVAATVLACVLAARRLGRPAARAAVLPATPGGVAIRPRDRDIPDLPGRSARGAARNR